MNQAPDTTQGRSINWRHVNTVLSAAILIGAEVFGAAYAGGWAVASLLGFDETGALLFRTLFFVLGLVVMVSFVRHARHIEPFTTPR